MSFNQFVFQMMRFYYAASFDYVLQSLILCSYHLPPPSTILSLLIQHKDNLVYELSIISYENL